MLQQNRETNALKHLDRLQYSMRNAENHIYRDWKKCNQTHHRRTSSSAFAEFRKPCYKEDNGTREESFGARKATEVSQVQTSPDYVGIAWKWLSDNLGSMMTDRWFPTLSNDSEGHVVVSGSLIDKTGENRSFSVLMTKDGIVVHDRSIITPKMVT